MACQYPWCTASPLCPAPCLGQVAKHQGIQTSNVKVLLPTFKFSYLSWQVAKHQGIRTINVVRRRALVEELKALG